MWADWVYVVYYLFDMIYQSIDDFKAGCFSGFNEGASVFDDGAMGNNFPWKIWFLKLGTDNYHPTRKCITDKKNGGKARVD